MKKGTTSQTDSTDIQTDTNRYNTNWDWLIAGNGWSAAVVVAVAEVGVAATSSPSIKAPLFAAVWDSAPLWSFVAERVGVFIMAIPARGALILAGAPSKYKQQMRNPHCVVSCAKLHYWGPRGSHHGRPIPTLGLRCKIPHLVTLCLHGDFITTHIVLFRVNHKSNSLCERRRRRECGDSFHFVSVTSADCIQPHRFHIGSTRQLFNHLLSCLIQNCNWLEVRHSYLI